ncbi:MAG: hypothetical protein Q8N53_23010 [Longimicrobiales bacterium]|nr:hypothetical protein [Longimicrobiales bacterium]
MRSPNVLAAALFLASPSAALATPAADTLPIPDPVRFETRHSGTFNGQQVAYRAVVGDIQLKRDTGAPYASLFTTAYLKDGVTDPGTRPVTFVFNGGPGSASVWLHLGLFGPKRVVLPSDAQNPGGPPYAFEPNGLSPLDVTDLVFIDPAGTGFSRLVGDGKPEDVYGLREDARSVAQLIREWLRQNRRWTSPVFIAGESFGTTRAAALLPQLMGGSELLAVSGVILISQALDYQGSTPMADATTSFVTYLPALYKRSTLGQAEVRTVAERYAAYTGLDVEYVLRSGLQVEAGRFLKELLRDRGVAVGRLDGRYVADEVDDLAERPSFDAASAAISAAYSTVLHEYLAGELGVSLDRPYHMSGPDVGRNWVWNRGSPGTTTTPRPSSTPSTSFEAVATDIHAFIAGVLGGA